MADVKQKDMKEMLCEVIRTLQDGQRGYVEMGERMQDDTLKRFFLAESLKRARFRADLENELHRQGVADVNEGGTAVGALRRGWTGVKAAFGGGDLAMLESAEQGEDEALKVYEEALMHLLPMPVHQVLSEQQAHIRITHDYVREHRDGMRMKKAS